MGSIQADTATHDASRRARVALALASAVAAACLLGLATSGRAAADTHVVTTASDSGAGSLRVAVAAAVGGDTVAFASSLRGETIEGGDRVGEHGGAELQRPRDLVEP